MIFWNCLTVCESLIFYFPFIIYALLRRIPFTTRCIKCNKWLLRWEQCWNGFCSKCSHEQEINNKRDFYENVYKRVAPDTHGSTHSHIFNRVISHVNGGKILDVGSGRGYMLSRLHSEQRYLFGTDISIGASKIAKMRVTDANICVADASELPFSSNSFDWLICLEVLEHIEGNKALKECLRVLKPGGKALFSLPNSKGIGGSIEGHVHSFTFSSSKSYIEENGFNIISSYKIGLYLPFLTYSLNILSLVLNKNIPFNHPLNLSVPEYLATSFFFLCSKPAIYDELSKIL